jgi:pimeloyl-ACP methyl ester carboxylesterase
VKAIAPTLFASRSEYFPYRERVFVWEGTPLMYFDAGGGDTPVVLVHGLGANLTHFEHVAPLLEARGRRVAGLDLPGFGLSGKPRRAYSIRYLSSAVLALLDRLQLERAVLCGHSLGGLVCADAALTRPERVERLVLINSAGLFRLPPPIGWLLRNTLGPTLLAHALERNAARLVDRVISVPNERTLRWRAQSLERPDPRFVRELGLVMWSLRHDLTRYHLHGLAERLAMPTLVVWGARDRLLPFARVPEWVARLPDGRLELIDACGHMAIIERPETVVEHIERFLARPLPGSAPSAGGPPTRPASPSTPDASSE